MVFQIPMISGDYKVRTITSDEFDIIYTRSSATVKGCLARFRRMFENSNDEWVAGLDVEYTTTLDKEKNLKEEEKMMPAVIQVACMTYAWSTTYAMPMLSVRNLRTSSRAA